MSEIYILILSHPFNLPRGKRGSSSSLKQKPPKVNNNKKKRKRKDEPSEEAAAEEEETILPIRKQRQLPLPNPPRNHLIRLVQSPFYSIMRHNRQESEATDLHVAAPFCYAKRLVGVFYSEVIVTRFLHYLIRGTRGLDSLCRRMDDLMSWPCFNSLQYYGPQPGAPIPKNIPAYLAQHGAPQEWIEKATIYEEAAHTLLGTSRTTTTTPTVTMEDDEDDAGDEEQQQQPPSKRRRFLLSTTTVPQPNDDEEGEESFFIDF